MAVIDVYNLQKEKTSEMELRDDVFQVPIKTHVLHEVVVSQLNARRSGNASTKTRSEVKRSGRKLYRQKGTGRARAGSAGSPTRRGGGIALGPKPRSYAQRVPKKVRKAALRMALSDKFSSDHLIVVSDFDLPEIKTKGFLEVLKNFSVKKALIVTESKNENLEKSSRNVPWVKVLRHEGLNVYDILTHDYLFLVQPAVSKIEEALVS
ncbi:MAG: 50S ribosomal protein L4 [Deltaproteobacteria bacterium]|nr:50S ribosomal protein L4 [Deltaproteobacteria bacterium]MBW2016247.1 50S ribosomal protein L4 [Deltaproteobacteria bacterium]MBW2130066.1 50S ribosomal protein L4 [Deltaproteobacteria bacterium]MBW2304323.1 50S ribosomal protein L4 [Deltaproteobacteria bacterium]